MISTCDMEIRLSDLRDKQVTTVSGERLGYISNVILDESLGITNGKELSKDGDMENRELLFTELLD